MVDLEKKLIKLKGQVYAIASFEVWWLLEGMGLCTTLEEALETSKEKGNIGLRPVPVAVSAEGVYEQV